MFIGPDRTDLTCYYVSVDVCYLDVLLIYDNMNKFLSALSNAVHNRNPIAAFYFIIIMYANLYSVITLQKITSTFT